MSHILTSLGLDRAQVIAATGSSAPKELPPPPKQSKAHLHGRRYKLVRVRLKVYEPWILGMYLSHTPIPVLAACVGVTEEAIRKRIRAHKLFNSGGKPGRPFSKPHFGDVSD